jgi:uncharacterized protein YjbI with pentapeptide repeats
LLVWSNLTNSEPCVPQSEIYAARLSASGEVLDSDGFALSHFPNSGLTKSQIGPAVVFDGYQFETDWKETQSKGDGSFAQSLLGTRINGLGVMDPIPLSLESSINASPWVLGAASDRRGSALIAFETCDSTNINCLLHGRIVHFSQKSGAPKVDASVEMDASANLDAAHVCQPPLVVSGCNASNWKTLLPNLAGCDLVLADLMSADLSGVNFTGAKLAGANLSYARLARANFNNADMKGTNLHNAFLDNTNLDCADLEGANTKIFFGSGVVGVPARLPSEWKLVEGPGGKILVGPGADLSASQLSGTNLRMINLSGADFNSASLRGADLSGANLSGANLKGADLGYAILNGTIFNSATVCPNGFPNDRPTSTTCGLATTYMCK